MKHAKTMLLAAASAVVLSLTLQASGADDVPEAEKMPWENTTEAERAEWAANAKRLNEKGRDAFPDMARLIDRTDPGSWELAGGIWLLDWMDGMDFLAQGDPDLLASVRRLLSVLLDDDKRHKTMSLMQGFYYLAKKGDARDFPLFEKRLADPVLRQIQSEMSRDERGVQRDIYRIHSIPYRILQHRVAGTNIVNGSFERDLYPYYFRDYDNSSYTTNWLRFIPSVANTGPQAAYVYAAMEQAVNLGRFEAEIILFLRTSIDERDDSYDDSPYTMIMHVAPELLTMRVWFDADGKAVCDVDLAKYGIDVPGLSTATDAPPPLEPPPTAVTSGTNAATPAEPPDASPARPRPAGLAAAVAGILAALLLLAALRRKLPRR